VAKSVPENELQEVNNKLNALKKAVEKAEKIVKLKTINLHPLTLQKKEMNNNTNSQQSQPKVLVFDNYDSFTYNLVQIIERILNQKVDVVRNDQITLEEVGKYDKIILSPGPGIPEEAGILLELIKEYAPTKVF
jgi:carbamoylphosphate synthase small subunit